METKTGIILAAGIGKRLDIFETNKPLVKLRGISLIIWSIRRMKEFGIEYIFVVIRKGDRLIRKELIEYDGDIQFIEQQYEDKGMLGSILSISETEIPSSFFIMPCDLVFDKNPLGLFRTDLGTDLISILISTNHGYNVVAGAQEKIHYNGHQIDYSADQASTNALEVGIYHFTASSYANFVNLATAQPGIVKVSSVFQQASCLNPVIMDDNEWFDINTPVTLIRADLFLQKKVSPEKRIKEKELEFNQLPVASSFHYSNKISFDVSVGQGLVDQIKSFEIIPHEFFYSPHHILIDKNIDELYGQKIYEQLSVIGYQLHKHLIDPGEHSKSIGCFADLAEDILALGIEKKSIILSVGGGVVKDLAGFIASTLYRGIGFICFPTTILSQCDAAVALKQGVNGTRGKNLIGSYYAPMKVIVDPDVLMTLEDRYIYDGLAECIKQSFAQDLQFFTYFKKYNGSIKNIDFLEETIRQAIALKLKSIQEDFHEEGVSLVNQYGHEVGHAIEHLSGYQLLHGESVAIGMRVSAELACIMGIAEKEVLEAHLELLRKFHLPVNVPMDIAPEDIINTLRFNKKFHGGKARLVLVDAIGSLWHDENYYTVFCSDNLLKEAINKSYA